MKRLVVALLLMLVIPSVAFTEDTVPLFKEFYYGQSKADIQKKNGIQPCEEAGEGALCLSSQPFAGAPDWEQLFIFEGDRLVMVALVNDLTESLYTRTVGAVSGNNFLPIVMQSGSRYFDLIAEVRAKGQTEAQNEFAQFEASALNEGNGLTYTFVDSDSLKSVAKKSSGFSDFIQKVSLNLRGVEIEVSNEFIYVRFLAPKKALLKMREDMKAQKESF